MSEVRLRDLGRWLSGGTPDTGNPAYWNGDIPWITSSSLNTRYLETSKRKLTSQGVDAGSRLVPPDTILFVVRGMSLKNEFRVGLTRCSLAFGQDCKAVVPADGVDPKFLLFALEAAEDKVLRMVDEASHGTGRLQTSLLGSLVVWLPPLEEQRRITEILDTIDETIRATERVIAKLAELLLGVLSTTVWATATGSADIVLGEVALGGPRGMVIGPFGSDLTVGDYRPSGVPVFFVRDVRRDEPLTHRSGVYVSEEKAHALRAHRVEQDDLVITKMGLPPGIAAVHDGTVPTGLVTADLIRLRPNPSTVNPTWLALTINGPYVARQVEAITAGVTRPKVTLRDFREMSVKLPNIDYQVHQVRHVRAVTDRVELERKRLSKLFSLRAGLAADLLSGRVRTVAT